MKKAFLIIPLLIAITATPVYANQSDEHRNEKSSEKAAVKAEKEEHKTLEVTVSGEGEYKNHGAYVSEVAKTHPGGDVVSEAAHSDIGKRHATSITPTPTSIITPTPTATATPTVTPTITPTAVPTLTATPSPTLTITQDTSKLFAEASFLNIKDVMKALNNFFKSFTHRT